MDRQQEEKEMDATLSQFGFDAFANGITSKAGVSPKRKRYGQESNRKYQQGRQSKHHDQVREQRRQKIEQSLKMGAQGFAETDCDLDDDRMDMNCFQDLRSEMGVKSEYPSGKLLTDARFGQGSTIEKKTELTPRMAQQDEIRDDIT